jgi:general secretion pathway protein D
MSDKINAMKSAGIDTSDMSADEITKLAAQFGTASANPIGGGLNYFLTSDKWDLSAVVSMAKSDSRTKVLASPILMTVDNKEATIEATDMIYLFSGYQYSGSTYSGSQVRNYEKRDIGLTVKVTPKINPNGTVMLTVEQTFETQGADQNVPNESGGTDPYATVTTRKISSDVSVENRQTVVMGGLTKKTQTESESGIPILKDIPWIGKWILREKHSVSHTFRVAEKEFSIAKHFTAGDKLTQLVLGIVIEVKFARFRIVFTLE